MVIGGRIHMATRAPLFADFTQNHVSNLLTQSHRPRPVQAPASLALSSHHCTIKQPLASPSQLIHTDPSDHLRPIPELVCHARSRGISDQMANITNNSHKSSSRNQSNMANTQASAYIVDAVTGDLTSFHYSTCGAGGTYLGHPSFISHSNH